MKTLFQINSTLGPPQVLRELRRDCSVKAAVARWSHTGAFVDLRDSDSFQVIFNISGGQIVELYSGGSSSRRSIRAGSVYIMSPGDVESVKIIGKADTLQFLMTREYIDSVTDGRFSMPTQLARCHFQIRAAAAQALVALTQNQRQCAFELESILANIAQRFVHSDDSGKECFRGGLSMGARRRVGGLIDDRLGRSQDSHLKISELAAAAGLSVHHFIKAFQQSEGKTPHAYLTARRIDNALTLLLGSNVHVDQISKETGFSSSSHFVNAFRTHIGVTPGAFRDAAHSVV